MGNDFSMIQSKEGLKKTQYNPGLLESSIIKTKCKTYKYNKSLVSRNNRFPHNSILASG